MRANVASHVSSPCPDWTSREMAWTRTGTFQGAKGKGTFPQTPPCPHSYNQVPTMEYLPWDIRNGFLTSPCLTPHILSLSSGHFPWA